MVDNYNSAADAKLTELGMNYNTLIADFTVFSVKIGRIPGVEGDDIVTEEFLSRYGVWQLYISPGDRRFLLNNENQTPPYDPYGSAIYVYDNNFIEIPYLNTEMVARHAAVRPEASLEEERTFNFYAGTGAPATLETSGADVYNYDPNDFQNGPMIVNQSWYSGGETSPHTINAHTYTDSDETPALWRQDTSSETLILPESSVSRQEDIRNNIVGAVEALSTNGMTYPLDPYEYFEFTTNVWYCDEGGCEQ